MAPFDRPHTSSY